MAHRALSVLVALTAILPAQDEGWVAHTVALAPDGSGAVFGRFHNEKGRGELVLRRGEEERVLGRAGVVRSIAFAPDGTWIVTTDDSGKLHRVGLDGKDLGTLDLGRVGAFVRGVAVSADGSRIAGIDDEKRLTVFRVGDGERLWSRHMPDLPLSVAFLPDDRVVTGTHLGAIEFWSADGGQERRDARFPGNLMVLAVAPTGRRVAVGSWNGSVLVYDLESHEITKRPQGEEKNRIYALAFDETGDRLAIAGSDRGVSIWEIGGRNTRLATEPVLGSLHFAGDEVLAADYRGGVHRFALSAAPVPPRSPAEEIAAMSWLAGSWSGAMWGGTFTAWYSTPAGGKIISHSKLLREEQEVFYEFEIFEPRAAAIVLRPFPGGKRAVGLTLSSHDPVARKALFENPKKDYPTRIVYHRIADDNLVITLSDPHGSSDKTERFDLKREAEADSKR